jgi:hypothetical protein
LREDRSQKDNFPHSRAAAAMDPHRSRGKSDAHLFGDPRGLLHFTSAVHFEGRESSLVDPSVAKGTIPIAPGLTGRQGGTDLALPMFSKAVAERLVAQEVRDGWGLALSLVRRRSRGALPPMRRPVGDQALIAWVRFRCRPYPSLRQIPAPYETCR